MAWRVPDGSGRVARGVMACVVAASFMLGGMGCNNNKAGGVTMEQLQRENEELRDREAQLQAALDDAENRSMLSDDERMRLEDELAQLRGGGGDTGFEGVSGATTSRRGSDVVVNVAGDVLFASGSVTLRKGAKSTLDQIADVLKGRYSSNEIRIAGHTDKDKIKKSKWKTNERLSAERALAVEKYLASRGVDGARMHISGYGSAKPKESKSKSRRVEIVVLGG